MKVYKCDGCSEECIIFVLKAAGVPSTCLYDGDLTSWIDVTNFLSQEEYDKLQKGGLSDATTKEQDVNFKKYNVITIGGHDFVICAVGPLLYNIRCIDDHTVYASNIQSLGELKPLDLIKEIRDAGYKITVYETKEDYERKRVPNMPPLAGDIS